MFGRMGREEDTWENGWGAGCAQLEVGRQMCEWMNKWMMPWRLRWIGDQMSECMAV